MHSQVPSGRELLRAIYRRLDREGLLADCPGLTDGKLVEFFRRWSEFLEPRAPSGGPRSVVAESERGREGRIILCTDGGSRGNPGPAGFGIVLTDESGSVLAERGEFIGRATCNEAEYHGLIAGLEEARNLGARELLIRADSQLLVRQISGQYKVKSRRLMPLVLRARELLQGFPSWRAEHVRREMNWRADALANEAMDCGA